MTYINFGRTRRIRTADLYHVKASRTHRHTFRHPKRNTVFTVVGSAVAARPNADLVVAALESALMERDYPKGLMFHSDQGSQYASRKFRRLLWRHRIDQSMSRRGNCWDNSPMERLFRSLKTEWIPPLGYRSLEAAQRDINDYFMRYYNWMRPHAANNGIPPARAEKQLNLLSGIC